MDGIPWNQILAAISVAFCFSVVISVMGSFLVYVLLSNRITSKDEASGEVIKRIDDTLGEIKSQVSKLFNSYDGRMCEVHLERLNGFERRLERLEEAAKH